MSHSDPIGENAATASRHRLMPIVSFSIGALAVTVLFAIGAWQRRWIADDGLIVLRTIRNLLAGNGPVFNAGERVEANTSTLWTYLLWFFSWITGADQTEYVALWVALILSVLAIPLAMYGTARLYGKRVIGPGIGLLLPLGAIIYISLPPARDFATSGLENGLTIFWVAALWCQFLAWARRRGDTPTTSARAAFLALAFTAGLAPLVRPEGAVIGVLVLLVLFCSPIGWKMRVAMTFVAGALPVGYQIFRMGYYAVLVPNPAIAKDASGSKWSQGWEYITNLFGPYTLLLPAIIAVVAGLVIAALALADRADRPAANDDTARNFDAASTGDGEYPVPDVLDVTVPTSSRDRFVARWRRCADGLQRDRTVVLTMLAAGAILWVYWARQGGDFMHGRVLLTPLFTVLLPVMVVPAVIPETARTRSGQLRLVAAIAIILGCGATAWWGTVAHSKVLSNAPMDIGRNGIVDERRFYVANMANENPVTAADYLDYPRMRAMVERIEETKEGGGIILPSANYDEWYVAGLSKQQFRAHGPQRTVYFLNLGMTSMNAPLDVRVIDQMGLAYPLAAHTPRLEDGRIGHDKNLPSSWVIAESGGVSSGEGLPSFLSKRDIVLAKVALRCPATKERFASYKDTWSFGRFRHNLRNAVEFNGYRIARQPEYEIARCGLTMPVAPAAK